MYTKGKQRVFYQTVDMGGLPIEVEFINPLLERTARLPMIYSGDDLYYIDIWFEHTGSYVVRAYKNGIKIGHNIIYVGPSSTLMIYPDAERTI